MCDLVLFQRTCKPCACSWAITDALTTRTSEPAGTFCCGSIGVSSCVGGEVGLEYGRVGVCIFFLGALFVSVDSVDYVCVCGGRSNLCVYHRVRYDLCALMWIVCNLGCLTLSRTASRKTNGGDGWIGFVVVVAWHGRMI